MDFLDGSRIVGSGFSSKFFALHDRADYVHGHAAVVVRAFGNSLQLLF